MYRFAPLAALAALSLSCGGRLGLDALTPDERDVFDRGHESHQGVQQALALSDSLFQFDPTLDATKTAAENAAAIQAQATFELNGCGSVTLGGSTVTVSFGAAPGCTLRNGVQASGSASLSVTKATTTTTVALTFTNLVVNGTDLGGTASFGTTNGSTFTVTANLTSKGNSVTANLTITGAPGSTTIDGTASSVQAGKTSSLTFTQVVWSQGDCYPKAGSLKVTRGLVNQTITFLATTPATGSATLTWGRTTSTVQLPAYGNCPPASAGG